MNNLHGTLQVKSLESVPDAIIEAVSVDATLVPACLLSQTSPGCFHEPE